MRLYMFVLCYVSLCVRICLCVHAHAHTDACMHVYRHCHRMWKWHKSCAINVSILFLCALNARPPNSNASALFCTRVYLCVCTARSWLIRETTRLERIHDFPQSHTHTHTHTQIHAINLLPGYVNTLVSMFACHCACAECVAALLLPNHRACVQHFSIVCNITTTTHPSTRWVELELCVGRGLSLSEMDLADAVVVHIWSMSGYISH